MTDDCSQPNLADSIEFDEYQDQNNPWSKRAVISAGIIMGLSFLCSPMSMTVLLFNLWVLFWIIFSGVRAVKYIKSNPNLQHATKIKSGILLCLSSLTTLVVLFPIFLAAIFAFGVSELMDWLNKHDGAVLFVNLIIPLGGLIIGIIGWGITRQVPQLVAVRRLAVLSPVVYILSFFWLTGLLSWSTFTGPDGKMPLDTRCQKNLENISRAVLSYLDRHHDHYPPTLDTVIGNNDPVLICPLSNDKQCETSYIYKQPPPLDDYAKANRVMMVYDKHPWHRGPTYVYNLYSAFLQPWYPSSRLVLFSNGIILRMPETDFQALLRKEKHAP